MKHCCNVKGQQVIIFQMDHQLKTKNITDVSEQLFCRQCKDNFCQRQTKCIDDQDKFQSFKDDDNESTEYQTPRKKLQSIGISPVSLHEFMKTLKTNISDG